MTMSIAGHETTAAVLTWGLFCLVQKPELMKRIQADIDEVFGDDDRAPTYEDIQRLESVRLCVAEALRLYPEPPILIRRCLEDVTLPKGAGDREITLIKGMDIFISVWNLHRSPECWENPDEFDPFRFKRPFTNPGVKDWAGYDPDLLTGLYPNEIASDYAFIPFGAGARKCIGDQFAMLESTVAMTMTPRLRLRAPKEPRRRRHGDGRHHSHRRRFTHESHQTTTMTTPPLEEPFFNIKHRLYITSRPSRFPAQPLASPFSPISPMLPIHPSIHARSSVATLDRASWRTTTRAR